MTPFDLALARARTYRLLAEIFLDGYTDRALAIAEHLPALTNAIASAAGDQLAAAHHAVLGRGVAPYESVFRSSDGMLGGDVGAAVRAQYQQGGFRADRDDTEPDHIGVELSYLAFLCAAEADAERDGMGGVTAAIAARARGFLDAHVLRWAPALVLAVRAQGRPEMTVPAEMALELACAHRAAVGPWTADAGLAQAATILDDPDTGLRDIASWLLAPANTGLWLGPEDLRRVAKRAGLPCGFGSRLQMLESLLYAGVDHEQVDRVLDALRREIRTAEDGYAELADLKAPVAQWQARLQATKELLDRMAVA